MITIEKWNSGLCFYVPIYLLSDVNLLLKYNSMAIRRQFPIGPISNRQSTSHRL